MIGGVDPGNAGANDQHIEVLDSHTYLQCAVGRKYESRRAWRQVNVGFHRSSTTGLAGNVLAD
jgi:hypothetical protein